ncbi:hypothetical protein BDV95DRAFT_597447 [Massariosphaeria phaeospora]|uniref:Uncharacterized protein n=1 Tax=Massariosphaeria phaeospora TaxID=100035 RepID=A0A7C8MAE8_9PLEO|nr:hypothetical protein BDV95DRAFT_597447 [Massariosphaeria phaeospora]
MSSSRTNTLHSCAAILEFYSGWCSTSEHTEHITSQTMVIPFLHENVCLLRKGLAEQATPIHPDSLETREALRILAKLGPGNAAVVDGKVMYTFVVLDSEGEFAEDVFAGFGKFDVCEGVKFVCAVEALERFASDQHCSQHLGHLVYSPTIENPPPYTCYNPGQLNAPGLNYQQLS